MSYSGDSSDQDKDSEFNSEEEDAEFRMYEQLYFEPNSDITETNVKSTSNTKGEDGVEKTPETDRRQFIQTEALKVGDCKSLPEMRNLVPPDITFTTASKIPGSQKYQFETSIFIDTLEGSELPLSAVASDLSLHDSQNELRVQQTELLTSTVHKVSFHDDAPPMKRSTLPSQSVRQRFSSTCSDGSIPGSIPLDGLYCNMVTSDEEEAEDDSIKEKLMMKDLKANDHGKNKESITAESTKRKRTKSSSDEMEDSRCNNLISVASKNSSGKSEGCHLNEDSNSDEDVYVLPPPAAVNPEVFTLDSSSDSELEVLTKDITRVRKQNNKYQKVEKAGTSSRARQSRVEKRSRKKDREVCESETDSSDVDFPEATKGTDLTLNIDRSLSGLVNTITKGPKVKTVTNLSQTKKAKKLAKKLYGKSNRSSVDFTRGRPDTKTKPSCEKWTQSMANFYDSDISDDFDVSEIHQQQSGSQADWHLVPADYQITQRRRYYNAPERCKLCKQEGHTSKECSRVPKCHLCSGTNHLSRNSCPDNCCFKCGEEPHFFCPKTDRRHICALCGYPGHNRDLCPDLWRRFHVTTTGMIAETPLEDYIKPPRERYCYVCAKRGHYGHECPLKYNQAYSQVPQSVVSYSCPVNLINGSFVVNTEGAQAPIPEEHITKMLIKLDQTGRIIGRKGVVVKAIRKESGAHVRVMSEGQPQVLLFGPSEARLKAQEIIEVLLGQKNSEKYEGFVEHLRTINRSNSLEDQRRSKKQSSTPAACITNRTPTTSGFSSASAPTAITTDESVPTVPEISRSTPVIASTSESTTTTVGVSESNQSTSWCEDFLFTLDRRKEYMLKKVKEIMGSLVKDESRINISCDLRYLRKFKTKRESEPSLKPNETLRRHMKKIAMTVIGKGKYGEGNRIYSEMRTLMKEVQVCPGKTIPENICVRIAKTLECLHEPPVETLDQLIDYGKRFLHNYLKKNAMKRRRQRKINLAENQVQPNENTNQSISQPNENTNNIIKKKKNKYKRKKKLKKQNGNGQSRNNKKSNAKIKKQVKPKNLHTNV